MLNIQSVRAAATTFVLKRVDTTGDSESEKTPSTMKYDLTHTVCTGAADVNLITLEQV